MLATTSLEVCAEMSDIDTRMEDVDGFWAIRAHPGWEKSFTETVMEKHIEIATKVMESMRKKHLEEQLSGNIVNNSVATPLIRRETSNSFIVDDEYEYGSIRVLNRVMVNYNKEYIKPAENQDKPAEKQNKPAEKQKKGMFACCFRPNVEC
jgi:hypothetical protein